MVMIDDVENRGFQFLILGYGMVMIDDVENRGFQFLILGYSIHYNNNYVGGQKNFQFLILGYLRPRVPPLPPGSLSIPHFRIPDVEAGVYHRSVDDFQFLILGYTSQANTMCGGPSTAFNSSFQDTPLSVVALVVTAILSIPHFRIRRVYPQPAPYPRLSIPHFRILILKKLGIEKMFSIFQFLILGYRRPSFRRLRHRRHLSIPHFRILEAAFNDWLSELNNFQFLILGYGRYQR